MADNKNKSPLPLPHQVRDRLFVKGGNNPFPQMEEQVLNFWEKGEIFEKSVDNPPEKPHPNPLLRKERGLYQGGKNKSPLPPFVKGGNKRDYVFYDGPPFATGTPHYGHIVASIMKDVVPRYWTMKGYRVERKWGWDCHGLPIENIVEKEMGSKSKKDIEKIGVAEFNEKCRSKVLGYVDEWEKVIRRLGRWADMKNAYKTMDLNFMESVWWVFKQLWDKGLIYEGYRSMHICPRCETTLSQQEVAEGYKDIKDLSATAKFELADPTNLQIGYEFTNKDKVYILAWTTTPWTLIGNVALAVREDIDYVIFEKITGPDDRISNGEKIIFAKGDITSPNATYLRIFEGSGGYYTEDKEGNFISSSGEKYKLIKELKGKDLVGKKYKPLFPYLDALLKNNRRASSVFKIIQTGKSLDIFSDVELLNKIPNIIEDKFFKIYSADFVSTDEGTGVVHIAPAFGEDDFQLAKKENFEIMLQHVDTGGRFKGDVGPASYSGDQIDINLEEWEDVVKDKEESKSRRNFIGKKVKPKDSPQATDKEIINWLKNHNKLFDEKEINHSYPFCWRCDTPLLNYAISSWFVNITKIKPKMLELAKRINWVPAHIKEGRFGNWLEGARDWSISRQRFWASVIPIWKCALCGEKRVVGSIKELEDASGWKVKDLHKHFVDEIIFACKCGGTMKRVPDVLDTWFDSGSMPYAQAHYPFENKEKFEANFPAEFIAEGVDQTRAWFYYLHIIATAIRGREAFKNVIVNGIVLAEDGKKMAKRLNNYPDPMVIMNKYGADSLRYYLSASPVMKADNINFSESGVKEALQKNIMILWNVYKFYEMFAGETSPQPSPSQGEGGERGGNNVLDKWILARLNQLIAEVTTSMEKYDLPRATRPIVEFINDLSTWYIRRSRERFKLTPQPPFERGAKGVSDREAAITTTKYVLIELAKVMAPFMPFMSEQIWQKVSGYDFKDENRSVHLEKWPKAAGIRKQELGIMEEMQIVRKIVELGLAKRDEAGIKVRQALSELRIMNYELRKEYEELLKDELNVKKVVAEKGEGEAQVELDTVLTDDLKMEGLKREIVRTVNNLRKQAGLTIKDRITLSWQSDSAMVKKVFSEMAEELKKDTLSGEIVESKIEGKEVKVNGEGVRLGVRKI